LDGSVALEEGEEEEEEGSTGSGFRPKALSSPDFLKTYRNASDWPQLENSDESEDEGEIEAAEEDSNPEVDIDPLKRVQLASAAAATGRVRDSSRGSSSGTGGSGTFNRRKRCETVASPEQM